MHRFVFWLALIGAATPHAARAQPSSTPIIFDDFAYDGAAYESRPNVRSGRPGTLYGKSTWTDGDSSWQERAWYRYEWWDRYADENAFRNAETEIASGDWGTGLALRFRPGDYLKKGPDGRKNKPPQVTSGFAYRTGAWVARINFDDMKTGSNLGGSDVNFKQAFWTHSPFVVQTQAADEVIWSSTVWDEIDHEFNNFFQIPDGNPGEWPYLSTGIIANGRPGGQGSFVVPAHAPRRPDGQRGGEFTCKYTYLADGTYEASDPSDVAVVLDPAVCGDIIGGNTSTPEVPSHAEYTPRRVGDVFSWVVIRFDGEAYTFRLVAEGSWGRIDMKRRYARHPATQAMSVRFSQYVQAAQLERTRDMIVDWFYYTPESSRSLPAIRNDVAAIRDADVARLNTTGDRLSSPYELTCADAGGQSKPKVKTEPCDWPYQKPTNTFEVTVDELGAAEDNQQKWAASLSPRQGVYRVDWSYRIRSRQGEVTARASSSWDDFTFTTPGTLDCEARLEVTATFRTLRPARFEGEQATGRATRRGPACRGGS